MVSCSNVAVVYGAIEPIPGIVAERCCPGAATYSKVIHVSHSALPVRYGSSGLIADLCMLKCSV